MKLILYQATLAITEIDFVPGPFRFQIEQQHLDFTVDSQSRFRETRAIMEQVLHAASPCPCLGIPLSPRSNLAPGVIARTPASMRAVSWRVWAIERGTDETQHREAKAYRSNIHQSRICPACAQRAGV